MTNFSIIKNGRLSQLVEQSQIVMSLPEVKKEKYIEKMAKSDKATQDRLIELFEEEKKLGGYKEQRTVLEGLKVQFAQLKKAFSKKLFEYEEEDEDVKDSEMQKKMLEELEKL